MSEHITDADTQAAPDWAWELSEKIVLGNQGYGNAAVLIHRAFDERITAHTAALIAGAGEVVHASDCAIYREPALPARPCNCGFDDQAAATIAAQKAEIERLTEREAQAKLDGVKAGIEASAVLLERDDGFGEWWDAAQFVRSELDAAAIAKGITTADTLSDLIAGDAHLIDGGDDGDQ